jgi:acyl transferase domain-containing protein
MQTVFMFSGQGSQYFQMGRELYAQEVAFRSWMERLDRIVRELSGRSVIAAIYAQSRSRWEPCDRTALSHPAIFMVEYSLAQTLIGKGVEPEISLGVSLGEFAAAALSGYVTPEDALVAVVQQAMIMESHCEPGGMIAVLGSCAIHRYPFMRESCEIAAVNGDSHFVVAAKHDQLEAIEQGLRSLSVTFQRLPVSLAFHSRWIEPARVPYQSFLRSLAVAGAGKAMACCSSGSIVSALPEDHFWKVARQPIRFVETIAQLEARGARRYVDVGPAGTLATLLKYTLSPGSDSTMCSILSVLGKDLEQLENVVRLTSTAVA